MLLGCLARLPLLPSTTDFLATMLQILLILSLALARPHSSLVVVVVIIIAAEALAFR